MKEKTSTPQTRWAKRSLKQQVLYKFINHYGYQQGPVVAAAIVDDIIVSICLLGTSTGRRFRFTTGPRANPPTLSS
jgi:hypothetical protein